MIVQKIAISSTMEIAIAIAIAFLAIISWIFVKRFYPSDNTVVRPGSGNNNVRKSAFTNYILTLSILTIVFLIVVVFITNFGNLKKFLFKDLDWKLILGVALPLAVWMLFLMIVFWKIIKGYTLNNWSQEEPNPFQKETLALPRGTIRGVLTLTILATVILLQIYAVNNMESMDKISAIINAFELMLAFYFGSKVMHHLTAADKNKTKAVAGAQKKEEEFNDPDAIG